MAHLLIAYYIMYHIVIKYALQILVGRQLQEQSLEQSIALAENHVSQAEQKLKSERNYLQQRLVENMPHQEEQVPPMSVNAGIERVQPSDAELKQLVSEVSKRLRQEVLHD